MNPSKILIVLLTLLLTSCAFNDRNLIEGNNGPKVSMYIGIMSRASNKHLRDSIRNSWAMHSLVKIRFFVAREWGQEYTIELETSDYKDIVLMHHKTEYDADIWDFKLEEIIKMSSIGDKFDYVVATRDDVFIREDKLISFVNEFRNTDSIIISEDSEKFQPNIIIIRGDMSKSLYSNITHQFKDALLEMNFHQTNRISENFCSSNDFITLQRTPYHIQCMYKSVKPRCCNS